MRPCRADPSHVTRSANDAPVTDETTITNLPVAGKLPAALSGQYMRIGPNRIDPNSLPADWAGGEGMVHAVSLDAGRAISYRNRWITTDAVAQKLAVEPTPGPRTVGDDVVAANLIAFGTSILAFGDGALAYELSARLDTIRRVDLAGARRSLVAHSKVDPHTGELHLLTFASIGSQLHVAVSRGALTRTIRSIDDAPSRIRQLELTRDDVVLLADGFIGVTARAGVNTQPDLVRDRHGGPPHRGCVRTRRDRHRVCHRAVPRPVDVGPSGRNRPLRGARPDAPHVRDEQPAAARFGATFPLDCRRGQRRTSTT